MQIVFIIALLLSFSSISKADTCTAVRWPFAKQIKALKTESLNAIPREHLYKYLYYEISSAPNKRIKGLAPKLFYYLKHTELNEDKYNMISALEWAADVDTSRPRVISINEICSIENKIRK